MSPFADSAASFSSTPHSILLSVTVDFDRSVLFQAALFGILVILLKPLLFEPMLKVFAMRESRTDGARAEAREMQEKAAELLSSYEKELSSARARAGEERESLRRETAGLEAKILEEGVKAQAEIVEASRKQMAEERAQFEAALKSKTQAFGAQIGSAVLGREVRS